MGKMHGTLQLLCLTKALTKILHARLQHDVNKNFQMSKMGLEKEDELEIKLPTFTGL